MVVVGVCSMDPWLGSKYIAFRCKTLNCELLVEKGWRSHQLCKVGKIYGSFLFQVGSELRGMTLDWIINVAMIM